MSVVSHECGLAGRVAVVAGATRGAGRGIAAALGEAGNDKEAREKASREYQKVYARRSEFVKEERTGFVWLYLRK